MTDIECTIESVLESMKAFSDHLTCMVHDVTLHPNDYIKLFKACKTEYKNEAKLPLIPFAYFSSLPVYVDPDVAEGTPEFNRQRDRHDRR